MERYRVRHILPNGDVSVRDVAFSQLIELLKGGPRKMGREFWLGHADVDVPAGNVKLLPVTES